SRPWPKRGRRGESPSPSHDRRTRCKGYTPSTQGILRSKDGAWGRAAGSCGSGPLSLTLFRLALRRRRSGEEPPKIEHDLPRGTTPSLKDGLDLAEATGSDHDRGLVLLPLLKRGADAVKEGREVGSDRHAPLDEVEEGPHAPTLDRPPHLVIILD